MKLPQLLARLDCVLAEITGYDKDIFGPSLIVKSPLGTFQNLRHLRRNVHLDGDASRISARLEVMYKEVA
jgi:hypothetical protein